MSVDYSGGHKSTGLALVKEAYAIYMAARKLHYYISNSDTTIRSNHMPLRRFLLKNTKKHNSEQLGREYRRLPAEV